MSYAEEINLWLQNAPVVKVQIGRYNLTFSYGNSYYSNWEWCWVCMESVMDVLDWEDTPEYNYFCKIADQMKLSIYDKEYIDKLVSALERNPFTQGETV